MMTYEFGYCALDMSAVYPRDTGVISCRATNRHGQIQTSCTLIVKEEKGLIESTQLPDKQQLAMIKKREREFKHVIIYSINCIVGYCYAQTKNHIFAGW